jgi:hypothetical protein
METDKNISAQSGNQRNLRSDLYVLELHASVE